MNRSRLERARLRFAALPECGPVSSTQTRELPCQPLASGKSAAFLSALLALAVQLPAHAQEAQSGASDQQASTLPPVVVMQQKTVTPASRPAQRAEGGAEARAATETGQQAASGPTVPGTGGTAQTGMFSLGGINLLGGTYITSAQMSYFGKTTLDQAMELAPGVSNSNSGGSRNEQLISVRGFNRWQVPLSIDGVRIYLPYDNRIDFSDFVTADISEVQIAKGYASVLDGPGADGGAINLVTKRPTKELEVEAGSSLTLSRDGSYQGFDSYGSVGTRQRYWYMLATGTINDRNGWMLSGDFVPSAVQGSGWRDESQKENWRVSAKVGITPNATDEYTLSVIHQESDKGAPLNVTEPAGSQRYWSWPGRDLTNIYENTATRIGEASYINTKAYYTKYNDSLYSYDQQALTTQTLPYAFRSFYNDSAYGGNVEGGSDITHWDTLKAAFFYRRDIHSQYEDLYATSSCGVLGTGPCVQPTQTSISDTYSAALENTYHVTKRVDFVTGASYDWRIMQQAQDWTSSIPGSGWGPGYNITSIDSNGLVHYALNNLEAFNWQSALIYRYSDDAKIYASVSDRTRFPTLFELYSTRFGGAASNPSLAPERVTNYEIGWAGKLGNANLSSAVFYSSVTSLIESVVIGTNLTQSQNVGDGYFVGWEGSVDIPVTSTLATGGNLTVMRLDVTDNKGVAERITGVPDVKGIAYVKWNPTSSLSITPNAEFASDRWTTNWQGTLNYRIGAYTIANISADYELKPGVDFLVTGRNLLDTNYFLTDGFPEPGRTVTVGMKMKF